MNRQQKREQRQSYRQEAPEQDSWTRGPILKRAAPAARKTPARAKAKAKAKPKTTRRRGR